MDPSEERYAQMTGKERWMHSHAKWVLIAADAQRRLVDFTGGTCVHSRNGLGACKCENRIDHLNAELLAHGVRISSDGSKVHYDPDLIINPSGCPR